MTIRVLCSNNAKEYFSAPFNSFLTSRIMYKSRLPLTPQQHDGVVECKHRHIVKTARTLLINAKAPVKFWGDTILTCYLINHVPSYVLGTQSPLFQQAPLYVVPMCVWFHLLCT